MLTCFRANNSTQHCFRITWRQLHRCVFVHAKKLQWSNYLLLSELDTTIFHKLKETKFKCHALLKNTLFKRFDLRNFPMKTQQSRK